MAGLTDYPRPFSFPRGQAIYDFVIGVPPAEKQRQDQQDMDLIRQSLPATAQQDRPNQTMVKQALPVAPNLPSPIVPTDVGVPTADMSRNMPPDRLDPTVEQHGQRNAFEQPLMAEGYQPTSFDGILYKTQGGQTEYQTPKGSMTFQGGALGVPGRQGGGTFSVGSGRTPEEQAAIDQRVAEIDKQTAAMRSLNNAKRQQQGLPSIEQEQEQETQKRLVNEVMQAYGDNPALAMNVLGQIQAGMKNRSATEAGAYQAQQEQSRWEAEQKLERQKAQADQTDKGYTRKQKDREIELDRQKMLNPNIDPVKKQNLYLSIVNKYTKPGALPGDPDVFNKKALANDYNVPTLSEKNPAKPNEMFYSEEDNNFYVITSDKQLILLKPHEAAEWALMRSTPQAMKRGN